MPNLFANHASDSDASQLLAQAQALSSRIAAVNEIATAINRSLDVDEILRVIGKQAKWLIDFDHLSVYLCGDRHHSFVTLFGPPVSLSPTLKDSSGSIGCAIRVGQPQLILDDTTAFLPAYPCSIVIPLESQRRIIGTINFGRSTPRSYTLNDVRIGYLLALQLAAAISNAERFEELNQLYAQLEQEKRKSDELLLNILPSEVADELKISGTVEPVHYESASVMFADFKDFTKVSATLSPTELFQELNDCFSYFDQVIDKYDLEKLKTIGDCYMCVGGVPGSRATHAIDTILAAIDMQLFMQCRRTQKLDHGQAYWDLRIGIHSGPLLAGVVGQKKFAYDIWGDTVNTASRLESTGVPGRINISTSTYDLVKNFFDTEYRGDVDIKNFGQIDAFFIKGIKADLSLDPAGMLPNQRFIQQYLHLLSDATSVPIFCQWAEAKLAG